MSTSRTSQRSCLRRSVIALSPATANSIQDIDAKDRTNTADPSLFTPIDMYIYRVFALDEDSVLTGRVGRGIQLFKPTSSFSKLDFESLACTRTEQNTVLVNRDAIKTLIFPKNLGLRLYLWFKRLKYHGLHKM